MSSTIGGPAFVRTPVTYRELQQNPEADYSHTFVGFVAPKGRILTPLHKRFIAFLLYNANFPLKPAAIGLPRVHFLWSPLEDRGLRRYFKLRKANPIIRIALDDNKSYLYGGILIKSVKPGSKFHRGGLRAGCVLLGLDRHPIYADGTILLTNRCNPRTKSAFRVPFDVYFGEAPLSAAFTIQFTCPSPQSWVSAVKLLRTQLTIEFNSLYTAKSN